MKEKKYISKILNYIDIGYLFFAFFEALLI